MSASGKASSGGFAVRTMLALVLVGVLAFVGVGVLSAYEPETRGGDDGGEHALSKSSVGFAGLVRLMKLSDVPVVLSRGPLSREAADGLLILTPDPGVDDERMQAIVGHIGNILIVLPKWEAVPEPARQGWVKTMGVISPEAALSVVPDDLDEGLTLQRRTATMGALLNTELDMTLPTAGEIEGLQTVAGPGWISVVVDDTGRSVLAWHEETGIYLLSDPDLLNTSGLKTVGEAERALGLVGLIQQAGAPVIFDLTLQGFVRSRSLLRLMFEPPLLGATLVFLALALLAGLQAAARFGPAREKGRAVALGKQALADNTAGLVRLARREHRMASPYALLVRAAVARAVGAPRRLSDDELNGFLDRLGATTGAQERYTALADRARRATTPSDLMAVAHDLHQWKQEMTRGRQ